MAAQEESPFVPLVIGDTLDKMRDELDKKVSGNSIEIYDSLYMTDEQICTNSLDLHFDGYDAQHVFSLSIWRRIWNIN